MIIPAERVRQRVPSCSFPNPLPIMLRRRLIAALALGSASLFSAAPRASAQGNDQASAARPVDPRLEKLKAEAITRIDAKAKMIQEMVDQVFSFGELGFQEFET